MGFRGLLELLGITLEAPPFVVLDKAICDISLDVGSPVLLWAVEDEADVLDLGVALPLMAASPDILMAVDNEALNLVCPY